MEIKRSGSQPSGKGPADWFTGTVRIDPLFSPPDPARVAGRPYQRDCIDVLYHIRVIRPTWPASATSGSRPFPCRGPARRRG